MNIKKPKQRNPFVQHIRMKSSGAHMKNTNKQERKKIKSDLKKGKYNEI